MIQGLPFAISLFFLLTVILTCWLFSRAVRSSLLLVISLGWLALTGCLAVRGFFADFSRIPPRLLIVLALPLLAMAISLVIRRSRRFIDSLPLRPLVLVSIARIPVEITLYFLFLHRQIPELMTFAGRNPDILAGISSPIIYFLCFRGGRLTSPRLLLGWHVAALCLLLNIVINALLSAPFPFQRWGFEQPNLAVFYFPFIWLPAYIVVVVLFTHLVSIRRLVRKS